MTTTERRLVAWYAVVGVVVIGSEIVTAYSLPIVTLLPLLLVALFVALRVK